MTVTATISTKNRYFSTLPLAINSIIQQTVVPDKFILFDDGEHKDLRNISPYNHLFSLLSVRGIEWKVVFGSGKGQLLNHQMALDGADTDFIYRIDDDEVPIHNCLENLLKVMSDEKVAAVGGLVLQPGQGGSRPAFASNDIRYINNQCNIQWYKWDGKPEEVDHIYSTFLYRVAAAKKSGGYCVELSPVAHREETLFTYQMKRSGYKLIITPEALTWHLRESSGGIRSYTDGSLWANDEEIFRRKLFEWGVNSVSYKFVVLDCGIGDHIVFKSILSKIVDKGRSNGQKIILSCCYPDVFDDVSKFGDDIALASIADAKMMLGDIDEYNIYKWCADRYWNKRLVEAFKEMYGVK
jgi:GT2 family glycosyltransferase